MSETVRDLVLLATGAAANFLAVYAVLRPAVRDLRAECARLREALREVRRHAGLPSTWSPM